MVIASRPAMGKTALALDIAQNLEKNQQKTTVLFSYEMLKEWVAVKMLQKKGLVDISTWKDGRIPQAEAAQLSQMYWEQTKIQIYEDTEFILNATVEDIQSICESTENLGAVIIDYVQLIRGADRYASENNRSAELNRIPRALKQMAKNLDVPVICTSQLSRVCERREDKRPILADLRDAGALIQDADQILFLYRDRHYNPETPLGDMAEIIVAKNRHGDVGTVHLQWNPSRYAFSDME